MTTAYDVDTLYALLPATIRSRDAEGGQPLYGLIAALAKQIAVLEDNLAQSYADLFIETCADWVVPYIGDLVGTTPLFDSSRVSIDASADVYQYLAGPTFFMVEALRSRADVGRTISYRRRKATRPMLEELAYEVTGWPAYAAEMLQRIRWTQCIRNHLRITSLGTPDLRSTDTLDRLDGPFDVCSHGIDVHAPSESLGWYQVPNVIFFLWRLEAFSVFDVAARPVSGTLDWRYHFSPLGNSAPLFAQYNPAAATATTPPLESQLPVSIRRLGLAADLAAYLKLPPAQRPGFTAYYGVLGDAPATALLPLASLAAFTIVRDGQTVAPEVIRCIDLDDWCQPQGNVVGVDPQTGRIAFGTTAAPKHSVDVWYFEGLPARIGGGSYTRSNWLITPTSDLQYFYVNAAGAPVVDHTGATVASHTTIGAALAAWQASRAHGVISIGDSRTYEETLDIALFAGARLTIEAGNTFRPHLRLSSPLTIGGAADGAVTLSGLLVEGALDVNGPLGSLRLLHSTLVPGVSLLTGGSPPQNAPATQNPSLVVAGTLSGSTINTGLTITMSSSITGPLKIPATIEGVYITDSIIDGIGGLAIGPADSAQTWGAPVTILRSTVLGGISVLVLTLGSESIFTGVVTAQRRQGGWLRFSYVPPGSSGPRRYRCQPDLEIASRIASQQKQSGQPLTPAESTAIRTQVGAWLVPAFTSASYGDCGYARLAASGPVQIATGAQDGSEMGVFSQLKQPQRAMNLVTRLGEYLPIGLTSVLVYVT